MSAITNPVVTISAISVGNTIQVCANRDDIFTVTGILNNGASLNIKGKNPWGNEVSHNLALSSVVYLLDEVAA
jgi:hypothetical protein